MKNKIGLILLTLLFSLGCSTKKLQKKENGIVKGKYSKVSFKTYKDKGVMAIDVQLNGETKVFLFDTGANLSLIQQDKISGKKMDVFGASGQKMKLGTGIVSSIKIGEMEFLNTNALNGDMVGLKEQIPNFGGIIGQPIIRKANWLIHYPKKEIEISNSNLTGEGFKKLKITRDNGNNPYTYLEWNTKKFKVVIDLGSSSAISLPIESEFAKEVSKSIKLTDNTRERYTLGGLKLINEKVGHIPKIKLGEFDLENIEVNINQSTKPRIGIKFFEDFQIYIDNSNGVYKLKRNL